MPSSLRASTRGLEIIDRLRKQKSWTKYATAWSEIALTSEATLKRFWRRVPIQTETFIQICRAVGANEQEVAEPETVTATRRQDWGEAPSVPIFFGRNDELLELERWIVEERCRAVAILGMGGIGKTQLSVKLGRGGIGKTDLSLELAKGIQDEFDCILWRSLLNAPLLTEILADAIQFFSNRLETDLPDTVDAQISRLLHYLKAQRCLLVLDNFETILQGGEASGQYREGYQDYGTLLEQIGTLAHQSCLLLTSREKPKEIAHLEGKTRPVRSLNLSGLNELEGRKIFDEFGRFEGSERDWQEVIEFYNGNPLALELAARHIDEVFFGDLSAFLNEGKPVFSDLRELLDWHFHRLSLQEREILYWLALHRDPMPLSALKEALLSPLAKEQVPSTLQSLQRRLPLERNQTAFSLQPVLIEDITDRAIACACKEIADSSLDFLNRHALLEALAKDYVRESQSRFLLNPIQERLTARFGDSKALETRLLEIVTRLRQASPQKPGYAAGNLLNLLRHLNADLRGQDFSGLAIWQAYLQGWNLPDTNFAGSHLAKSVFTQRFGTISSVAFSPDGVLLAAGMANGDLRIWRIADSEPLMTCRGHTDWPWSIAFSPDGRTLASGSQDRTVRLWDANTGQCLRVLQGHESWIKSVAFSADGSLLASGSNDKTARLWGVETGECRATLEGHSDWVWSVALSPRNGTLASGGADGVIQLWDVETGENLASLKGHADAVKTVVFSPDGKLLASGSFDKTVRLWDADTGECIKTLEGHAELVWSVLFSPDGQILASNSDDRTTRLWDAQTGQLLSSVKERTNRVWSIAFSPDGSAIASNSDDQTIRLWEVKTGQTLKTMFGYSNAIWSAAFHPSGRWLATGDDRAVQLWDASTEGFSKTVLGYVGKTRAVAFSPDGRWLASGSDDGNVRLWDIATGQCWQTLHGHTNRVWSVAFNASSARLVSCGEDRTVRLWEIATGQTLQVLEHHSRVWSVVFLPQNNLLVSSSDDELLRVWNAETGEIVKSLAGHRSRIWSVAAIADGSVLASGSADRTVRLWDIETGECLRVLEGHTDSVWSVAFSPQGNLLASAGTDRTVRLWDIETGECLRVMEGHAENIWSVAFSPDGETLASNSNDETLRLWSMATGTCLETLRSDRPYERMNISGVTGITEAQKLALKALGAVEER